MNKIFPQFSLLLFTVLILSPLYSLAQQCSALFENELPSSHKRAIEVIVNNLPDDWTMDDSTEHDMKNMFLFSKSLKKFEPIYETLKDEHKYAEWVYGIIRDVEIELGKDQIPLHQLSKTKIQEKYLDRVVIKRAKKFGFKLNKGKPFWHFGLTQKSLYQNFIEQKLFYDAIGAFLPIKADNGATVYHGSRSHALQLLFLAEYIPNFVELYRDFGLLNNTMSIDPYWYYYFDRPSNTGVRNNALFSYFIFHFMVPPQIPR